MLKKTGAAALLLATLLGISGCDTALVMGSHSMGVRSGEFVYEKGYVVYTYRESMDRVWQAAEAVLKDMKAYQIERDKKIAKGTISGLVTEEKVTIRVEFLERGKTSVAILVGMVGSRIGAGLIHDKITRKLSAP